MEDHVPTPLITERTIFRSRLSSSGAEPVAMGAFFVAPIAFMLAGPNLVGATILLVTLAVGLYHSPALFKKRAPVIMDRGGITLDGLGHLPWSAVDRVETQETYLRTMKFERVALHLTGPAMHQISEKAEIFPLHKYLFKVWQLPQPDLVIIKAELLSDEPGALAEAIKAFLDTSK